MLLIWNSQVGNIGLLLLSHDILHHTCDFYAGIHNSCVGNSILASVPKHPILKTSLERIAATKSFKNDAKSLFTNTGPIFMTDVISKYLCRSIDGIAIYPSCYFYPFPNGRRHEFWKKEQLKTLKKYLTPETFSVHLWAVSWINS